MCFGLKWWRWIETCLKTASVSILVNGSPTEEFYMTRGVRQGDSLSHFLFILAAEGLNILVREAVDKGIFTGVKVGVNEVSISHLQYADDTIFFGEWNRSNVGNLTGILNCFDEILGLKVNMNKSRLYGVGVDEEMVTEMARWAKCSVWSLPISYQGIPVGIEMRWRGDWKAMIEKFKKRPLDWKARKMSFGGRLTLVKMVLGSLALNFFSIFRAPACLIDTLEKVRRELWGE